MFGIGFGEIVVIFIILIIFIKPEDLPKFLRSAGRLYGKAKKMYNEVIQIKNQIIKEIDEAATLDAPSASPSKTVSATIAEALSKPKLEEAPAAEAETPKIQEASVQELDPQNHSNTYHTENTATRNITEEELIK